MLALLCSVLGPSLSTLHQKELSTLLPCSGTPLLALGALSQACKAGDPEDAGISPVAMPKPTGENQSALHMLTPQGSEINL